MRTVSGTGAPNRAPVVVHEQRVPIESEDVNRCVPEDGPWRYGTGPRSRRARYVYSSAIRFAVSLRLAAAEWPPAVFS